jgi:hypothetical protein
MVKKGEDSKKQYAQARKITDNDQKIFMQAARTRTSTKIQYGRAI